MLQALTAFLCKIAPSAPPRPPQSFPSSSKTIEQNFKAMRLRYRTYAVDESGRWWKIEARQCPHTGVFLRTTERITD